MNFNSQYELLDPVPGAVVKTYNARQFGSGRAIMIHVLPTDAEALLRQVALLGPETGAQILDRGLKDGATYIVTVPLPSGVSFEDWLAQSATAADPHRELGARTGKWDVSALRVKLDVPPAAPTPPPVPAAEPGEFTRMFQSPAPPPTAAVRSRRPPPHPSLGNLPGCSRPPLPRSSPISRLPNRCPYRHRKWPP